jgi:hypothetical protein
MEFRFIIKIDINGKYTQRISKGNMYKCKEKMVVGEDEDGKC